MMEASLKEKLNNDLKQALRSGDKVKLGTIRLVLSAANNAEIAKRGKLAGACTELSAEKSAEIDKQSSLTDADFITVIAREIKQRHESIDAYKLGNRPDLVAQEEAELAVLQSYMPKQVSRDEIVAVAHRVIVEVGARSPTDKGKVMPKVISELKGKADGREINAVVTELLSAIR
ncbi:MAG: GatB/YqeY domain-containing protein [Dehalococcoidales bacterium]|nr:GatB/YqeY domain-containing protein [Dehalococcoidales bacterium]